jgi:hypothetical protein
MDMCNPWEFGLAASPCYVMRSPSDRIHEDPTPPMAGIYSPPSMGYADSKTLPAVFLRHMEYNMKELIGKLLEHHQKACSIPPA